MRLLAWVEGLDHVCCRYRLRAFEPALRAGGHTLEYYAIDSTWPFRPSAWRALGRADAVILQRKLLPAWQRLLLSRTGKKLIYDFDDAIFMRDSYAARGPYSRQRWGRFRGLAQELKKPLLTEHLLNNVFFDTCVYHQPGIDLLTRVIPVENILFASEMIGAVRGIDPETGFNYDDTKRYIEAANVDAEDRYKIYEGNARRVYPRLDAALKAKGV